MVAEGSLIESVKASSQNSLFQGFALAVALQISLFVITSKFFGFSNERLLSAGLSIQLHKINIQNTPTNTAEPESQRVTLKPTEKLGFSEQIMAPQASSDNDGREAKPTIQLSTNSVTFQGFLEPETDRNIDSKQNALSEFSATFKVYFDPPETTIETNYRDFQGALGGGQYKVYKNGKVTCLLNIVPLSFDDHVYGAGGGARDCTPKKKFDLNLRKNTRE
jgi:hypothetical protein